MSLFFFSSRRRHTRLQGDWSSDVCSSDLPVTTEQAIAGAKALAEELAGTEAMAALRARPEYNDPVKIRKIAAGASRSEERRVGKESRSRWWPYAYKTKRDAWERWGGVTRR